MKLDIVGVIGDIHGEDILLAKTVAYLRSQNINNILCVGDIVDGGHDINRCCQILQTEKVISVLGNHDRWFLSNQMRNLKKATALNQVTEQTKLFLTSLPITYEFSTPQGLALLCHGLNQNDMARLTPDDYGYAIEVNSDLQTLIKQKKYRYVVNGHTHSQMVRTFKKLTIINTGTLKREHNPGFIIINFKVRRVLFYEFIQQDKIAIEQTIDL